MQTLGLMIAPLLYVAVVLYVAYPLLREDPEQKSREQEKNEHEQLLAEKENLISSLKDLEMDYRMGKLSDEDYAKLKAEFEQRAVEVLERLDSFEQKQGKDPGKKKS